MTKQQLEAALEKHRNAACDIYWIGHDFDGMSSDDAAQKGFDSGHHILSPIVIDLLMAYFQNDLRGHSGRVSFEQAIAKVLKDLGVKNDI